MRYIKLKGKYVLEAWGGRRYGDGSDMKEFGGKRGWADGSCGRIYPGSVTLS